MSFLPTVWELLIPNFNISTVIGVVIAIIGIGILYSSKPLERIFGGLVKPVGIIAVLVSIILIWGVSIIEDFASTLGGNLMLWGTVITSIVALLLFYEPKKRRGRK